MDGIHLASKRQARIWDWLAEAWNLTVDREDVGLHLLVGLVITLGFFLLVFTIVGPALLYLPVACGLFYFARNKLQGQKPEFNDVLKGFDLIGEGLKGGLMVLGISLAVMIVFLPLCALIVFLGVCCPPIEAVVLLLLFLLKAAFLTFGLGVVPALMFDRGLGAWEALKANYELTLANFWDFYLFNVIMLVIFILGIVTLMGLVLVIPFAMYAYTLVYRDRIGLLADEARSRDAGLSESSEPEKSQVDEQPQGDESPAEE